MELHSTDVGRRYLDAAHKTLRVMPTIALNVADRVWSLKQLVEQTSG